MYTLRSAEHKSAIWRVLALPLFMPLAPLGLCGVQVASPLDDTPLIQEDKRLTTAQKLPEEWTAHTNRWA